MKSAAYQEIAQYIPVTRLRSETVCRAVDAMSASIKDMRIDHGRIDIPMPEEFSESVTTGRFRDSRYYRY
jgi:hypothetical protein